MLDTSRLKVALIDQQRVFADALAYRLSNEPGFSVISATGTEDELPRILASNPDVVLLDADLPLGRALDMVADIHHSTDAIRVLLLLQRTGDAQIDQALRAGANGLLSRSDMLAQFVEAIRRAAEGEFVVSPVISARLEYDSALGRYRLRSDPPLKTLTDRQLEILRYLARGDSVKTVARKLFLSPKSVDNQKFRIMNKIGVRDKVSLALYAVREGLIQP